MKIVNYDVLVIGGGTSGTAAGIQSARLGVKTLIIEETPWLGGMITSAGVSAFDGNKYALGGGIFGELRKKIEDYYGGPDKTYTGWISLTCFEPHIGKKFLHELVEAEENLDVWFETKFIKVIREGNKITGAVVKTKSGEEYTINSAVTMEATEFGDVIASAGIPYRLGRDASSDTKENNAPELPDDEIQDMTFCAILKKFVNEAPRVNKPKSYNAELFINSTAVDSNSKDESYLNHKLHDWESFITYALLPNDKYLLNWPFRSNDYRDTKRDLYENPESRNEHFSRAKDLTLSYIHYIQTRLNHPEWGLAEDEFPTEDKLPFIPYIRESRRIKGIYLMVEKDVVPAENSFRPPLQKSSIAVGDYFLDHHHSSFFNEPEKRLEEKLPANAPFQVPYFSLIPKGVSGLLAAEKSISVSHIVNGCTRLQPVVMLIGQAAGAAAALSVKKDSDPRDIPVGELQEILLAAGCQLFPYKDLLNNSPCFISAQKLALEGVYVEDESFTFDENRIATDDEICRWMNVLNKKYPLSEFSGKTRGEIFKSLFERDLF
jgi:hypothetical protein